MSAPLLLAPRLATLVLAGLVLGGCASAARFGEPTGSVGPTGSDRFDQTFSRNGQPQPMPERRPSAADDDVIPGGGTVAAPVESVPVPDSRPADRRTDTRASAIDPAMRPADTTPVEGEAETEAETVEAAPAPAAAAPAAAAASGITSQARAAAGTGAAAVPVQPQQQAALAPSATQVPRPASQTPGTSAATAVTGTWTVTDAGDRCRITLTSSPLFEYYRAAPQNCRAPSLSRINAWEMRGNEVVLLQSGGRVAARLFPQGGNYQGATATGATITMTR